MVRMLEWPIDFIKMCWDECAVTQYIQLLGTQCVCVFFWRCTRLAHGTVCTTPPRERCSHFGVYGQPQPREAAAAFIGSRVLDFIFGKEEKMQHGDRAKRSTFGKIKTPVDSFDWHEDGFRVYAKLALKITKPLGKSVVLIYTHAGTRHSIKRSRAKRLLCLLCVEVCGEGDSIPTVNNNAWTSVINKAALNWRTRQLHAREKSSQKIGLLFFSKAERNSFCTPL